MNLIVQPRAGVDLEEIGDYIAQDNPRRALSFVLELREQCAKIALSPQLYRTRPELGDGIRTCAIGQYIIVFDIQLTDVRVIRILHGSMDILAQLNS